MTDDQGIGLPIGDERPEQNFDMTPIASDLDGETPPSVGDVFACPKCGSTEHFFADYMTPTDQEVGLVVGPDGAPMAETYNGGGDYYDAQGDDAYVCRADGCDWRYELPGGAIYPSAEMPAYLAQTVAHVRRWTAGEWQAGPPTDDDVAMARAVWDSLVKGKALLAGHGDDG